MVFSIVILALWLCWAVTRVSDAVLPHAGINRPRVARVTTPEVLAAQSKELSTADTLPVVAQPRIKIPAVCVRNRWYDMNADADCYLKLETAVRDETKGDPLSTANLCWGYAPPLTPPYDLGVPAAVPPPAVWAPRRLSDHPDGGGVLFHMILLTGLGSQAPMTLVSWLATQCCNARLWVWSPTTVNTSLVDPYIPEAHSHRIVYKRLDVFAEWGAVADDFKGASPPPHRAR